MSRSGQNGEAANFAIRSCPEGGRSYERKKRTRNGIVAIKAQTHMLARARYHMLQMHTPFEVARCCEQTVGVRGPTEHIQFDQKDTRDCTDRGSDHRMIGEVCWIILASEFIIRHPAVRA